MISLKLGKEPFCRICTSSIGRRQKAKGGGQNGMAFCRQLVGECLLLLVVESTQFTGKNSREIAKMSRGGGGGKKERRFVG